MKVKNTIINNSEGNKDSYYNYSVFENKILYFQDIIRKTIICSQKYKILDIISSTELNASINCLEKLFECTMSLLTILKQKSKIDIDSITESLQSINNELAIVIKSFGTEKLDDLIRICLGSDYINKTVQTQELMDKFELLSNFTHPISYKTIIWKNEQKENEKKSNS